MALPQGKMTLYFQLITKRSFAEAERILDDLKKHSSSTEWSKGYLSALDGMMVALKSNDDQYAFITKLDSNPKKIEDYKNEFVDHSRTQLHEDFDRGFFSAWADYMRVLAKWKPIKVPQPSPLKSTEATNPTDDDSI